jgi:hypothetical protein
MKRKKKPDNSNRLFLLLFLLAILTCYYLTDNKKETKTLPIENSTVTNFEMANIQISSIVRSNSLIFDGGDTDELMRFETDTGDIYYKQRKITSDKQLVKALNQLIMAHHCPQCGGLLEVIEELDNQYQTSVSSCAKETEYYLTPPDCIPKFIGEVQDSIIAGYCWQSTGTKTTGDWVLIRITWEAK